LYIIIIIIIVIICTKASSSLRRLKIAHRTAINIVIVKDLLQQSIANSPAMYRSLLFSRSLKCYLTTELHDMLPSLTSTTRRRWK